MMKISCFIILFTLFIPFIRSGPIPIKLDENQGNKGKLEFALQLPNNDTVQIDLSFHLLTISKTLPTTPVNNSEEEHNFATTTTEQPTTEKLEPKYVTVAEAIETFRQDLIKKELEIAGIIESDHLFYRHFKLQFADNIDLAIRCTYDSNYAKHSLNISCYEYHEFETERILSNGEVEIVKLQDLSYKTDVEFIDARHVTQMYKMEIS